MNSFNRRRRLFIKWLAGFTAALLMYACDSTKTQTPERNANGNATSSTTAVPLSIEDTTRLEDIAKVLGLTESQRAVLRDLLERNHPAVKPLHDLIIKMDARLAPYIKDEWILFSAHTLKLKQRTDDLQQQIDEHKNSATATAAQLETARIEYETLLTSFTDAEKRIRFLLGYEDQHGNPLAKIRIASGTTDDAISTADILEGSATSFRALATYASNSATNETKPERDVTQLATWEQFEQDSPFETNKISPNVIALKATVNGSISAEQEHQLKVCLGGNLCDVKPMTTIKPFTTSYKAKIRKIWNGELADDLSLPAGALGQVRMIATVKSHTGAIQEFDVSSEVTWSFQGDPGNSVMLSDPIGSPTTSRPGLIVGFKPNQTLGLTAKIDGKVVMDDINVSISDAMSLGYFYPHLGVDSDKFYSIADSWAGFICNSEGLGPLESTQLFRIPTADEPAALISPYYNITFVGTIIEPGLHQLFSDCTMTDVSNDFQFLVGSESGYITQQVDANGNGQFIAAKETKELDSTIVSAQDTNGQVIDALGQFSVNFEIQRKSGLYVWAYVEQNGPWDATPNFTISSPSEHGESKPFSCYKWTGNQFYSYNILPDDPGSVGLSNEPFSNVPTSFVKLNAQIQWNDCLVEYLTPDEAGKIPYIKSLSFEVDSENITTLLTSLFGGSLEGISQNLVNSTLQNLFKFGSGYDAMNFYRVSPLLGTIPVKVLMTFDSDALGLTAPLEYGWDFEVTPGFDYSMCYTTSEIKGPEDLVSFGTTEEFVEGRLKSYIPAENRQFNSTAWDQVTDTKICNLFGYANSANSYEDGTQGTYDSDSCKGNSVLSWSGEMRNFVVQNACDSNSYTKSLTCRGSLSERCQSYLGWVFNETPPTVPLKVIYQAGDSVDTIDYTGPFVFKLERADQPGVVTEIINTTSFGDGSTSASKTNEIPGLCQCDQRNRFKMTINAREELDVAKWQSQRMAMLARSANAISGADDIRNWMVGRLGQNFNYGQHTIIFGGFDHDWSLFGGNSGNWSSQGGWNDNDDFKAIFTCQINQCPDGTGAGTTLEFIGTNLDGMFQ